MIKIILFLFGFIPFGNGFVSKLYDAPNPYGVFILDGGHHTKPHGGLAGSPFWKPSRHPILHPGHFPSNLHKRTSLQGVSFILTPMGTLVPIVQGEVFQDPSGFYLPPQLIFDNQNLTTEFGTFGTPSFVLQPSNPQLIQSPELIQFVQPTGALTEIQQPEVTVIQTTQNPEVVQVTTPEPTTTVNSTET